MKKVIVVSKTHLDLGFTDYAEVIHRKYIEQFIPQAVKLAKRVNTAESKNFIWTTGSWIIKEALENSDAEKKEKLIQALKDGNIVPHALPFTTHSELFDKDTFDFGLSIVDDIDEIRGVKSESALQRLLERDLIKDVGRLEVPGRPILYGTTDEFLRQFGLQSLKELPSLDLYEDSDADNSLELLNSALQGIEEE